jgi:hypothetical protein
MRVLVIEGILEEFEEEFERGMERYDDVAAGSSGVMSTLPSAIPPFPFAGILKSRFGDRDLEASLARRRTFSLVAINSRASASDWGPMEIVRLRRRREESMAGISEAGGKILSSLGRGGMVV